MQVWIDAARSHFLADHPALGPEHTPSDAGTAARSGIHSVGLSMDPVHHQKTEKP